MCVSPIEVSVWLKSVVLLANIYDIFLHKEHSVLQGLEEFSSLLFYFYIDCSQKGILLYEWILALVI